MRVVAYGLWIGGVLTAKCKAMTAIVDFSASFDSHFVFMFLLSSDPFRFVFEWTFAISIGLSFTIWSRRMASEMFSVRMSAS